MFLTLVIVFGYIAFSQADLSFAQDDSKSAASQASQSTEGVQPASPLHELDWMVGVWVDRNEASTITTSCYWTHNKKFLRRTFKVESNGELVMEGTQVVGWDPVSNRIRSWTFDSEGGFGEGWWIRDGSKWLVKTAFTLASRERASSLNIFEQVDSDSFRWQSTSREIGGVLQPNIPEVTIVRQNCPQ
jgi:hypothetical protein